MNIDILLWKLFRRKPLIKTRINGKIYYYFKSDKDYLMKSIVKKGEKIDTKKYKYSFVYNKNLDQFKVWKTPKTKKVVE